MTSSIFESNISILQIRGRQSYAKKDYDI